MDAYLSVTLFNLPHDSPEPVEGALLSSHPVKIGIGGRPLSLPPGAPARPQIRCDGLHT